MTDQNYEYRGLMASTWDFFRADRTFEDRNFFLDVIDKYGQPVLDVGCGTGRLLLDFLSEGIEIDGVDNLPDMLEICREKSSKMMLNPRVYEQWMENLNVPRKYRTIIVPSSSFQLVTDSDLASKAMKRFLDHLEPDGVLTISFFISTLIDKKDRDPDEWHLLEEKEKPEDGSVVRHWIRARWDTSTQLQHTENRYDVELSH